MFKRVGKEKNIWPSLKNWFKEEKRILLTASSIAGAVILLRAIGLLQPWEWAVLDLFFRWRPSEPVDERVVIVGINEADLQKYGYPIPDGVMAQLLQKLHRQQPQAIGLDIYRDLPVEPGHQELVKAFETIPNLIGIEKIGQHKGSGVRPPDALEQRNQIGFNNVVVDADGKVRRMLLYLQDETKYHQSFALKLGLIYLQNQGIKPESAKSNPLYLQLGQGVFERFEANDGPYVQADTGGYQVWANLRGNAGKFRFVSMTEVLEGKVGEEFGRSRIVLIGATASSVKDFYFTSYSGGRFNSPREIPGVELHAHFISQILSAALEGRTAIHTASKPAEYLWILVWSWVGAMVSWKMRSPSQLVPSLIAIITGTTGCCYILLIFGWWLPIVPPMMALAGSAAVITSYLAHLQEEFKRSTDFFETVINTIPDPIFVKDKNHRRIVLNHAYCRFIGYPREMLIEKTDYDLFPQQEADVFWQQDELVFNTSEEWEHEEAFTDANGITHLIATKRSLHKDAAGNLFLVGAIRDITERKRLEEDLKRSNAQLKISEDLLRYQAYHDALTGLPNRQLFQERLNESIAAVTGTRFLVAVLFLDLDGFKLINDSLGHNIGDLLLKKVAERLKGCLRGSDTISRLGGDEFTVILPTIPGKAEAARVAQKIRDTITQPLEIEGHEVSVTTSIGISLFPLNGEDIEILIKNADTAMYRAKELGKNRYEFS